MYINARLGPAHQRNAAHRIAANIKETTGKVLMAEISHNRLAAGYVL